MSKLKIAIPVAILLVIGVAGYLWLTRSEGWPLQPSAGLHQKISVASDYSGYNALLWIAKDRGFAGDQGLELDIRTYETGLAAITVLKTGHVDLACCTEFVLVGEILQGNADLRILAGLSSGDNNEVIARRDRGISRPEDLRGKIIAVPKKTSAEFSLGRYLALNNISLEEVTVIDVKPWNLGEALASGKADAVLIWEPIIYDVMNKVGSNAITWPAQQGQDLYWVLVGRENLIKKNPAALEKLLLAFKQAANFIRQEPEEARAIIAARLKIPASRLQAGAFPKRYDLFLDQALILALEDEASWMIENKLTRQTKIPNFLTYFYVDALAKVSPRAMQLIIPRNKQPGAPETFGTGQVPR
jgi:NitT/TauT family transport system substrate-binding protein